MITKNDCLTLLVKIEDDTGVNTDEYIQMLLTATNIPIKVLQFLADQQGLAAVKFYEGLRARYNQHKSPLYKNLVKDPEFTSDIPIILSSLLTQILLYGNKIDDKEILFKEVRVEEITKALNNYFNTGNLEMCFNLLKLIRTDLLVLEYIAGRRELN